MRRGFRSGVSVIVCAAFTATACDDPRPPIDSSAARATIDATIAEVGTDDSTEMATCVIDGAAGLIDQSFDLVDDDVVEMALAGGEYALVAVAGEQQMIVCGTSMAGSSIGIAVGPAPESIDEYAESIAGAGADTEVSERADERRAAMHHLCTTDPGEPSLDVCQVTWHDEAVVVAAFVGGAGAGDVDLGLVEERFRPLIQLVVDGVAEG